MTIEDYRIGQHIEMGFSSDDFYGIIQGAMRLADDANLNKLKAVFPEQWDELKARHNATVKRGKEKK